MLCFCALALGKERQKGKTTMTGIGYALLLGGGISNFIDRMKKGSVTDYVRFPKFPVKKISELDKLEPRSKIMVQELIAGIFGSWLELLPLPELDKKRFLP